MAEEDKNFFEKYMWWLIGGGVALVVAAYFVLSKKGKLSGGAMKANFITSKNGMLISTVLLLMSASFSAYKLWTRKEGDETDRNAWIAYISSIVLALLLLYQSVTRKPVGVVYSEYLQNQTQLSASLKQQANKINKAIGATGGNSRVM